MNKTEEKAKSILPVETINTLTELGKVLEKIYLRMKSEGYDIIDGRIIHLETGKEYVESKPRK